MSGKLLNNCKAALFYIWDIVKVLFFGLCPMFLLPKKSVRGEIVLITGGGSGFGRELAKRFADLGSVIIIWDINAEGNLKTKSIIEEKGGEIHAYTCDVSDRLQVKQTAEMVKRDVGKVTILVNNAGIVYLKSFLKRDDELIEKLINVNLTSNFWTCKAFLPDMMENNHGQVVFMSSASAIFTVGGICDYVATKTGLLGMADSVGMELMKEGKEGVKTTVLCPSITDTGMLDSSMKANVPNFLNVDTVADQMMDAILTEKEIATVPRYYINFNAIKYGLSRKAKYLITGIFQKKKL